MPSSKHSIYVHNSKQVLIQATPRTELHGKMVYVIKTIPHYPHQEGTKNDPQFGHRDFSLLI